jgi:DNA polymerase
MATFHPAYLLRNYVPENRKKVWEDMKKILAELGLPVPQQSKN